MARGEPSANDANVYASAAADHPAAPPSRADPRLEVVRELTGPLARLAAAGDLEAVRALSGVVALLLGTSSPAAPAAPTFAPPPVAPVRAPAAETSDAPPANAAPPSPAPDALRPRIDFVTDIALARARREGRPFRVAAARKADR